MSYRMLAASDTVCLVILSATDQSSVFSSSICISARLRLAAFVCGWTADCFRTGSLTFILQCQLSFVLQFMKKRPNSGSGASRIWLQHDTWSGCFQIEYKMESILYRVSSKDTISQLHKQISALQHNVGCLHLPAPMIDYVCAVTLLFFSGFCQNQVGGNLLICNWRECHCECQR